MNWQPVHASQKQFKVKRSSFVGNVCALTAATELIRWVRAASRGVKAVMGKRSPFVPDDHVRRSVFSLLIGC